MTIEVLMGFVLGVATGAILVFLWGAYILVRDRLKE